MNTKRRTLAVCTADVDANLTLTRDAADGLHVLMQQWLQHNPSAATVGHHCPDIMLAKVELAAGNPDGAYQAALAAATSCPGGPAWAILSDMCAVLGYVSLESRLWASDICHSTTGTYGGFRVVQANRLRTRSPVECRGGVLARSVSRRPRSEDAALTKAHVLLLLNDAAAAENVLSRFYAAVNQRIGGNHGSSEPSGPPDRPPWHLTVPTRPLTFTQVRMEWEDIVCPERVK